MVTKYIEKVKIYNHYTNYKGRLFIKTLCDLFNDVAEEQTVIYGVDVDTMNKQGMTCIFSYIKCRSIRKRW